MSVKIAHATSDENKLLLGGAAGDQSKKEVVVQNWYCDKDGWVAVFRAKNSTVAEKIAIAAEQACNNDNIGYDQRQRTTLFEQAKKVGWNISKIRTKCECDCSSLVSVCVNAAGITISKDMYTGNQMSVLSSTKMFNMLIDTKYLTDSSNLARGDILLGRGHTAIVISSDNKSVDSAKSFSKAISGTYRVSAERLNVRRGAGTDKEIIITVEKGTKLSCYGYYSTVYGTNWLYVQFTYKAKKYTGFVSAKYVIK